MEIPFYLHNINEDDIQEVIKVLHSPFLTTGKIVEEFEHKFANYLGVKHVIAVTSCTAALSLSLRALNISKHGVITTPLSFISTANSIYHANNIPVFIDVDKNTGNLDLDLIDKEIDENPCLIEAILPVHLYGQMVDMRKLREIADDQGLFIIEDAAHAVESSYNGIRPGQLSDVACFSFYATKNLTCGEGGAIATNNDKLAEKLRRLRLHGMTKSALDRYHSKRYEHYDMIDLGYKYNMDNIHAALLINQLDRLDSYWERRRVLYSYYKEKLSRIPNVQFPKIVEQAKSAYHLFTIWVPTAYRDNIMWKLQQEGIGIAVNFRSITDMSYYNRCVSNKLRNAQRIGNSTISLPFYPRLTFAEIDYISDVLNIIMKEYEEIRA